MPNILEWKKRFFRLDKIHDVFLRLLSVSLFEDGAEVHTLKRFSYGGIQRIVDAVRQRLLKILLCISRRRACLLSEIVRIVVGLFAWPIRARNAMAANP